MNIARGRNQNIIAQLLGQVRACMLVPIMLASATAVAAQSTNVSSQQSGATTQPVTTTERVVKAQAAPQQPATNVASPASKDSSAATPDAGNTQTEVLAYYEHEVERITSENTKLKALYSDGLVARVALEASDNSLTEAQAKVAEVKQQIAAAALKPPTTPLVGDLAQTSALAWTTGNVKIDGLIRDSGSRYGVDPYLVFCVISQESAFKARAKSVKGAHGLMQLMPGTAARYGVRNPYDPAQSIAGGTRYLKDLLQLFSGRVDLALAGYNAGEGAVMKYGYRVPPYSETQNYVRLISAHYTKSNGAPLTVKL
jgi:soluble lytic murein transglycosylase-like protein